MRTKPVVSTNCETGEKLHFPSVNAAGEALGIQANQISTAKLTGRKCHGHYFDDDLEDGNA